MSLLSHAVLVRYRWFGGNLGGNLPTLPFRREIIKKWIADGVIKVDEYDDPGR
jgi:hypothetical protein